MGASPGSAPAQPIGAQRSACRTPATAREGRVPTTGAASRKILRREAAERAADVALAQALERAVAELANAFARHAEHRTDFFQRVLAATLEPEVKAQHLRVARWERSERELDLVGEEAIHRLLLRVRHLIGDEPFDERPITFRIHRRVEPNVAGVQGGERLHDIDRQAGELRELFGRWFATKLLPEDLRRLDDAREIGGAV